MNAGSNGLLIVTRAADFAARRHVLQRRKGVAAEPYINHLAEVALLLTEATGGADPELIAAGWLHDTVEDTDTSAAEIEALFGARIANIVLEVTDDKTLPKAERKRLQVANAPHKSAPARMIKIADKISNLRAIVVSPPEDWNTERKLAYVAWARAVADGCAGASASLDRMFSDVENSCVEALE